VHPTGTHRQHRRDSTSTTPWSRRSPGPFADGDAGERHANVTRKDVKASSSRSPSRRRSSRAPGRMLC